MLEGEKVVFTTMPNSTLFDAAAKKQNIGVIWDISSTRSEVLASRAEIRKNRWRWSPAFRNVH